MVTNKKKKRKFKDNLGLELPYNSANCTVRHLSQKGNFSLLSVVVINPMAKATWRRKDFLTSLQIIVHLRERAGQEPRQTREAEAVERTA